MQEPEQMGDAIKVVFSHDLTYPKIPSEIEITLVRTLGIEGNGKRMPWTYISYDFNQRMHTSNTFFSWNFLQENCSEIKIGVFN